MCVQQVYESLCSLLPFVKRKAPRQNPFDYVGLLESRNGKFDVNSFKEPFQKVPPDSSIAYLLEICLCYQLTLFRNSVSVETKHELPSLEMFIVL